MLPNLIQAKYSATAYENTVQFKVLFPKNLDGRMNIDWEAWVYLLCICILFQNENQFDIMVKSQEVMD